MKRPVPEPQKVQTAALEAAIKRGIAKQLKSEGLLSDSQLSRLLTALAAASPRADGEREC